MAQNMSLDSFHFPGNTKQSINVYFGDVDPALYIIGTFGETGNKDAVFV